MNLLAFKTRCAFCGVAGESGTERGAVLAGWVDAGAGDGVELAGDGFIATAGDTGDAGTGSAVSGADFTAGVADAELDAGRAAVAVGALAGAAIGGAAGLAIDARAASAAGFELSA